MLEDKIKNHDIAMKNLSKKFRLIYLRIVLIWLAINAVVDITTYFLFIKAHIEIFIVVLFVCFVASTWVMIAALNKWRSMRAKQEEQLLEKAPIGRMRL